MSEVSFYHLTRQPLDHVLPRLLERVLAAGRRAVVLASSDEVIDHLDRLLWTYESEAFLPHGTARTGFPERQPIYLTTTEENPNQADVLALVDGRTPAFLGDFARCLDLFEDAGKDAARRRWVDCRDAGHDVTYWQQGESGGWEKKG